MLAVVSRVMQDATQEKITFVQNEVISSKAIIIQRESENEGKNPYDMFIFTWSY